MGKLALGAGVGAWLAWLGAVAESTPPHQLGYWSAPSWIATAAVVVGTLGWALADKADPRIGMLEREVAELHLHLRDAHRLAEAHVTTGTVGPAGPPQGPANSAFTAGAATAQGTFTASAGGTVQNPPPAEEEEAPR